MTASSRLPVRVDEPAAGTHWRNANPDRRAEASALRDRLAVACYYQSDLIEIIAAAPESERAIVRGWLEAMHIR